MRIVGAENCCRSRWRAHLACGHSVLCHHDLDSPKTTKDIPCPVCGKGDKEKSCDEE